MCLEFFILILQAFLRPFGHLRVLPRSCSPLHSLVCIRESVPESSIKILKKNYKHTLRLTGRFPCGTASGCSRSQGLPSYEEFSIVYEMISKRYNLINNLTGWAVFAVALVTYWLTREPTASYWDCGEFIIQADKLEVGHPPGNPIFMLTARFFSNFAPSAETVSVAVNAMSGLLSALTILFLFRTITHLVRRLTVKDGQREEISLQQYPAIMGSGVVGALAYCWSDTFRFSAVEGEVYAFSSFCTALVFG